MTTEFSTTGRLSLLSRNNSFYNQYIVLANETPLHSDDDSESVLSIQAKETDHARDTSDTDSFQSDVYFSEYEAATDAEDTDALILSGTDTENEIIATEVIKVDVLDKSDLDFADSEDSQSACTDPELGRPDYWKCAQCCNPNNNPLYRYCEKCFKVRKNFFPPRPKRKCKQTTKTNPPNVDVKTTLDKNNIDFIEGFRSPQFSSNESKTKQLNRYEPRDVFESLSEPTAPIGMKDILLNGLGGESRKRKLHEPHHTSKRAKGIDDSSSSESELDDILGKPVVNKQLTQIINEDCHVSPLIKTVSDPSISVQNLIPNKDNIDLETAKANNISMRAILKSLKEKLESSEENNQCIVCLSEPKSGVFVHGRIAHICCCYKCALKVWGTIKRCPVCNCKVSNVLKAVM